MIVLSLVAAKQCSQKPPRCHLLSRLESDKRQRFGWCQWCFPIYFRHFPPALADLQPHFESIQRTLLALEFESFIFELFVSVFLRAFSSIPNKV